MTVSTGEASLIADLVPRTGVDLPPIPDAARDRIAAALPTMGYIGNPLDPWGAADPSAAYAACFGAMADSGAYDVLAIVHDFPYRSLPSEVGTANEVTRQLLLATRDHPDILPVYVSLTSGEPPPETKALLDAEGEGAPLLRGAVEAFTAIAAVARWEAKHAARSDGPPWRSTWPALAADRTSYGADTAARAEPPAQRHHALPERESLEILRAAGCAVTSSIAVPDATAAVEATRPFGGHAVALKLDVLGVAHKSDLGLVSLGVVGDADVAAEAERLLAAGRRHDLEVRGLLVQPMADPGLELIVGMQRDPSFGPVVVVGLGGVLADVLDDVVMDLAPLTRAAAHAMLDRLRGARILDGVRGRPPVDRERVVDLVVAIGDLAMARDDIMAIDLNPVIASIDGAVAVDALVVVDADA